MTSCRRDGDRPKRRLAADHECAGGNRREATEKATVDGWQREIVASEFVELGDDKHRAIQCTVRQIGEGRWPVESVCDDTAASITTPIAIATGATQSSW